MRAERFHPATTPSTPLFAISAQWIRTVSTGFERIISPLFFQCWQRIILRGISEQAYSKAAYKMGLGLNFACEPEVPTVSRFFWDYQTMDYDPSFGFQQFRWVWNGKRLYPTPSNPLAPRFVSFKLYFSWYFLGMDPWSKKAAGFFDMAGYGGDSWSTPFAGHLIGVLEVWYGKGFSAWKADRTWNMVTWKDDWLFFL